MVGLFQVLPRGFTLCTLCIISLKVFERDDKVGIAQVLRGPDPGARQAEGHRAPLLLDKTVPTGSVWSTRGGAGCFWLLVAGAG